MGVMSSSVYSPRDHDEESLPLPRGLSSVALSIQNKVRQYSNYGEFCDVMTIHTGNECYGM